VFCQEKIPKKIKRLPGFYHQEFPGISISLF
jgi:hypothetical protein